MIYLKEVSKAFKPDLLLPKKIVVNQVSFEIKKGSITGFLGANGAGKSTIIKLIMGYIRLDGGEITFDKSLGEDREEILSRIGFLPEHPYFYPHLTGREFLSYMGKLNQTPLPNYNQKIEFYSRRLGLRDHLGKKINNYSKGMLQRLGLMACLIHNPLVLILDEPLSGVDPVGRKEIKEILLELNETGKTIFFSSHILTEVEEICDRVIVLESGTVKFQGKKSDLLPKKESFIVKFCGKIENINPSFIIKIKKTGDDVIIETPENTLENFIKEILAQKSIIHSITRKNSTIEEVIYGINK